MRIRCRGASPRCARYYAARGIKVCDRWQHSFANFLADMGEAQNGKSLDRIDNNGGYTPENCRWATREEQGINKRNNRLTTLFGRTQTVAEWSRELDIPYQRLLRRLKVGPQPAAIVMSQLLQDG
jgi:hypothetical protein